MVSFKSIVLSQAAVWLPRLVIALIVFCVFYAFAKFVRALVLRGLQKFNLNNQVSNLLARCAHLGLNVFGVITALGTLGIDVSALVAGLGLTGFALGFALKDTISNILAGVLLLVYQPFRVSDRIKVSGFEGEVIDIDLRYTSLKNDGSTILIPNSNLFTNPIEINGS